MTTTQPSATGQAAEPDAWQERQECRPGFFGGWYDKPNGWSLSRPMEVDSGGIKYQFRPLYATPQPQQAEQPAEICDNCGEACRWHAEQQEGKV